MRPSSSARIPFRASASDSGPSLRQASLTTEKIAPPFCHSERSEESLLGLRARKAREIPRSARNDKIKLLFLLHGFGKNRDRTEMIHRPVREHSLAVDKLSRHRPEN